MEVGVSSRLTPHVLSTTQFIDRSLLDHLFERTAAFKQVKAWQQTKPLSGKVVATIFYEPSTRTRLSFESAVLTLGGQIISTESAGHFSSAAKGETLEDTIRVVSAYADAIVLRHPDVGAAERAAAVSNVPIINAGDGLGEHPSQALLDLFTIHELKARLDGLTIALVGDLRYGRTVHSLSTLLSQYDVAVYGVAPPQIPMPDKYKTPRYKPADTLNAVLPECDVIYMTRIQKERFESVADYDAVKDFFVLDNTVMKQAKRDAIILHPLPRVNELAPEVDADPRAKYFEQAANGKYVRMALLEWVLTPGLGDASG